MRTRDLKRLIADEGKILKNIETGKTAYCIDVFAEKVDKWEEVEDTENKENKIVGE